MVFYKRNEMDMRVTPAALATWVSTFAQEYLSVCLLIENYSETEYLPFYTDILQYFEAFLLQGSAFDAESAMRKALRDFQEQLKRYSQGYAPDAASAADCLHDAPPTSVRECYELQDRLLKI